MLLWVHASSSIFAIKALCAQFLFYLKERAQDDSPLLMIPGPHPSVFYLFLFFIFIFLLLKGKKASGEWERCQVLKLLIHVFVRL